VTPSFTEKKEKRRHKNTRRDKKKRRIGEKERMREGRNRIGVGGGIIDNTEVRRRNL
jgi:hypothetical protein